MQVLSTLGCQEAMRLESLQPTFREWLKPMGFRQRYFSISFKIPRLKVRGEFAVPIYLPAFSLPSIIAS